MTELNYRFIMGYLHDDEISMDEISQTIDNPMAYTKIDGKKYALDEYAIRAYERYKNSLEAEMIYLSKASGVPYAVLYTEVVWPYENHLPIQSVTLEEIFKRSLFDFALHEAVCECINYEPKIFENVKSFSNVRGKDYFPGDSIMRSSKENIFSYKNTLYVIRDMQENLNGLNSLTAYRFHNIRRTFEESKLYESVKKDKLYPVMVADVVAQQKAKAPDILNTMRLAMHITNTADKIQVADCINAYSNRIAENTKKRITSR